MRSKSKPMLRALLLAGAATSAAHGFLSSQAEHRAFGWTAPTRSVAEAVRAALPAGLRLVRFSEGRQELVPTEEAFIAWVNGELLEGSDPFAAHGGQVPLPWPPSVDSDQLEPGHFVAYTRRQLCFIVAKSLIGSDTAGYANGLKRYLEEPAHGGEGGEECLPRTGGFGRSLLALLQTCYADPALAEGAQGPLVIVAKASPAPPMAEVRAAGAGTPLEGAGLRVCPYGDGGAEGQDLPGVDRVPIAGCRQPKVDSSGKWRRPGSDFMTGGLEGQATQDISAAFLGGYVFGNACGLGGGQDERLMTYMPEVGALAFFLSQASERPQLRQPAWVLGARMLFDGLDGTARFNHVMRLRHDTPLVGDLKEVTLAGSAYNVSSSRPFVAFQSENQGFYPSSKRFEDTPLARRNRLAAQREVSPESAFSFEKQVRAWYRSVALTSYSEAVRPALRELVSSLGTGPWLAGLWWGDTQLGLLAVWLGHALAAATWRTSGALVGPGAPLPVDYYVYAAFTESPGSQCFVHSRANCRACVGACLANPLPDTAFWMPPEAFFDGGESCVPFPEDCGENGIEDVVSAYRTESVATLWQDVETSLAGQAGDTSRTVFDELLAPAPSPSVGAEAASGGDSDAVGPEEKDGSAILLP